MNFCSNQGTCDDVSELKLSKRIGSRSTEAELILKFELRVLVSVILYVVFV